MPGPKQVHCRACKEISANGKFEEEYLKVHGASAWQLCVPFVFQTCQFVLKPVISGLRPAKMIRFVWKMFLKTTTLLFMVKTSALQIKPA